MSRTPTAVTVVVLALLAEQPRHPYDVFQTLVERGDDRLVRVNPGAVYHAVDRLERDGLVEAVGTERAGNR
ncbi:PadR family transcriptional regulator, partial [Cellulomonas iranensis]